MVHIKKYLIFLLILLAHSVNPAKCKHFVLVHGAAHGAWCWYKVVPSLRSSGHNVTAIDLAASGIDSKQVRDVPFLADYISPLMDFMVSLPPNEKVILVGHSYGGFVISQAMENFPERVAVAVFVTAGMLGPHTDFSTFSKVVSSTVGDTMDTRFAYDNGPNNPPTSCTPGQKFLAERLYNLSPIQDLTLATLLVRPMPSYGAEDMSRTLRFSDENYGSVSRVFILSDQDNLMKKDIQQWMISENPPNEVREIKGSDHMVMMSKPNELLVHLLDISQKYSSLASYI